MNVVTMKKICILFCILSLPIQFLNGQKTEIYSNEWKDFNKGLELYRKEKYGAAQRFFSKSLELNGNVKNDISAQAQFYSAMCAIELSNDDAEFLVNNFTGENAESPLVNNAWFRLADYFFRKRSYPTTLKYYEKVDRFLLDENELSEYYYQIGYSYYIRRDYANARVAFYEIKDIESKYSSPALYYYSHIAYEQGNYETSLNGFLRLTDDETFSQIAPYYIAQIYYLQKKYEQVIEFVPSLIDSISGNRAAEISKIIGESYFYLERYAEALPYLEKYSEEVRQITIEDKYQLAYSYYKTNNYKKAIVLFEQISMTNTEISQSALYHLADCYLKSGDKSKARIAFSGAARMDFDPAIKQDALFNFAKVTYELSYSPFNEAIRVFNSYINLYPASSRTDEAYSFLVMAYLNTRNYRMAMESLEKIKVRDRDMDKAYQRVSFYRGLELFTNLRFTDAIISLDKSLRHGGFDQIIRGRTLYWLAESYYRQGDIPTASDFYFRFLNDDISTQTPEYKMMNYSLGYLSFSKRDYGEAEKWFSIYVRLEPDKTAVTFADAYNRLGDCRFIASSYWQAIDHYDKVIQLGKADVPYAMFQKGFTLGLVDRPQRKIEVLQQLLKEFPSSSYVDDALFETGRTWVILDNSSEAISNYKRIIVDFPNSSYVSHSFVQLGLIHRNAGENEKALEYYLQVVEQFPGTPEASNVLRTIREIYVDLNRVEEYLTYVEKVGYGITISEQDSLIYYAAENVYLSGDCDKALPGLNNYIARFSTGSFLLNAHYYRADCLLKQKMPDDAFTSLQYIISQPSNLFTEPALNVASRIAYSKEDYNLAAQLFQQLIDRGEQKNNIQEAERGLMRSYYHLGEYGNTIKAARQVLLQDRLE